MQIIVPLAGPGYFQNGQVKGLEKAFNGEPQLLHTLNSRPWSIDKENLYIFILQDSIESRKFAENHIKKWFKNSKFIYLSNYAEGAALSAVSAISLLSLNNEDPIIFDLADIYFEADRNPDFSKLFITCSFIGYAFKSQLPIYSYFKLKDGNIIETKEKEVISDNASAGVYIYKSKAIFLEAFTNVIKNPYAYTHNKLLFLAPVLNGLTKKGHIAKLIKVKKYIDYKKLPNSL
tara:strand:- start:287 stop:985 length:699 start_codon:yes stop_codon:yes gene_type:complete